MEEVTAFEDMEFPAAWCEPCGREALVWIDYSEDGSEVHRCVECDAAVGSDLRPTSGRDLAEDGMELSDQPGCGQPGCGGGRCQRG